MVEHAHIDDAAIARCGGCSGALIAPDLILTAGHCLTPPLAFIEARGERIAVRDCIAHPSYRPGDAKHDLGVCRLERSSITPPLRLDLDRLVARGSEVTLLGFGSATPFGPPARSVRRVDTTVTGMRDGILVIGTSENTACTGDSGAPVLAVTGEVIGVVHGTSGRFCASPADVVSLASNRDWLSSWRHVEGSTSSATWPTVVVAAVLLAVVLAVLGRIRRRRKATL